MARFKTVKKNFTSLPNDVIQGFYLTPNELAILITCLSYPNDWDYRPISIWKKIQLSRDKIYRAFDGLVEKGHCIRIRHFRGNLRAEIDYIFFDEIATCEQYIQDHQEELSANDLQVEHKWNFQKTSRHPEPEEPEGWKSKGQEVSKKIGSKKIEKEDLKESNSLAPTNVHRESKEIPKPKQEPQKPKEPEPPPPKPVQEQKAPQPCPKEDSASFSIHSIPSYSEGFSMDESTLELVNLEEQYLPYFRPEIVARWVKKYKAAVVLKTIRFFFQVKSSQKKPIPKPEAWMEAALRDNYATVDRNCTENKKFAENLKKLYNLKTLKINKRYCYDTTNGKEYYYHLPCSVFQEQILRMTD